MANETKYFKTPFAESGTRTEVPNASVGGAVGFDTGFGSDYELPQGSAGRKRIERDKYNGLHHSITKNLKQWQEKLYPTWIEDAGSGAAYAYPVGMIVNHNGQNWASNEAANQEEPGVGTKWDAFEPLRHDLMTQESLNAAGGHDDIYSRNFDSIADMISYAEHFVGMKALVNGTAFDVVTISDPMTIADFKTITYVTPYAFGAVGGGVGDDTDAIVAAIEYIRAKAGSILIQDDTFLVRLGEVPLYSNIKIFGNGTLKAIGRDWTGTAASFQLQVIGALAGRSIENTEICGITIDGSIDSQTNYPQQNRLRGIELGAIANIKIHGNRIIKVGSDAIRVVSRPSTSIDTLPKDISISHNIIEDAWGQAILMQAPINSIVDGNICTRIGHPDYPSGTLSGAGNGIEILSYEADTSFNGSNNIITNNVVTDTTRKAIYIHTDGSSAISNVVARSNWAAISIAARAKNSVVDGNIILKCNDAGILAATDLGNEINGVVISNNIIDRVALATVGNSNCIQTAYANDVLIEGNRCFDWGVDGFGIRTGNGFGVKIINNVLKQRSAIIGIAGIQSEKHTSNTLVIDGNDISGNVTTGIIVLSTAPEALVVGNKALALSTGISFESLSGILKHNTVRSVTGIASTGDSQYICNNYITGSTSGIVTNNPKVTINNNEIVNSGIGINVGISVNRVSTTVKNNSFRNCSTRGINFGGTDYTNLGVWIIGGNTTEETPSGLVDNAKWKLSNFVYYNQTDGNIKTSFSDGIPTKGTWSIGDTVINVTPTAGGADRWRCTAAGLPGTWTQLTLN